MSRTEGRASWVLALLLGACSSEPNLPPKGHSPAAANNQARLTGRVLLSELAAPPEQIPATLPPQCATTGSSEHLVTGPEGTLAGAVIIVNLSDVASPPPREDASTEPGPLGATITMTPCGAVPRQVVMTSNSRVVAANGHSRSARLVLVKDKIVLRTAQLAPGAQVDWQLTQAGSYQIGGLLDEHWLVADIIVSQSPYVAMTGEDGRFAFDGLPPGDVGVVVHHRLLGQIQRMVQLRPGDSQELEITF